MGYGRNQWLQALCVMGILLFLNPDPSTLAKHLSQSQSLASPVRFVESLGVSLMSRLESLRSEQNYGVFTVVRVAGKTFVGVSNIWLNWDDFYGSLSFYIVGALLLTHATSAIASPSPLFLDVALVESPLQLLTLCVLTVIFVPEIESIGGAVPLTLIVIGGTAGMAVHQSANDRRLARKGAVANSIVYTCISFVACTRPSSVVYFGHFSTPFTHCFLLASMFALLKLELAELLGISWGLLAASAISAHSQLCSARIPWDRTRNEPFMSSYVDLSRKWLCT